ncbi:mannonate dehydratase [Planctomycetota bacterium]
MKKQFNRREVLASVGATAVIGSTGLFATDNQPVENSNAKQAKRPVLMKVGSQRGGAGRKNLEFLARHGVYSLDPGSPKSIKGVGWDLADALAQKEACQEYGISIEAYHLPLSSAGIGRVSMPNILLGKSPERDREIEIIQQMILVAGKAGVKVLQYNTTIHKVLRTGKTTDPARGNASYSTWNYEEALKQNKPKTIAGDVSVDEIYERITYLLDRILPVAEEYNVKLANHIADPPTPIGYRGITRWNSPDVFAGIKRFAQLSDSPSHGFNLCLGSVASGLKDPKTEIVPIIKWVGRRNQIFNIHMRNIRGGWNNFQEVYPDNGDMDLVEAVRALRDVGYTGMIMPDHVPDHSDPESGSQARAFVFGYIKALIQAVSSEA